MFPALKRKIIISSIPLTNKMQSEPNQTNYSYVQIVKPPPLQNVIKQNNIQIRNAAQEQQTNSILELKNMVKDLLERME
jgi:hypothetical protein